MRRIPADTWVVYKMAVKGQPDGVPALCEQREWDAMQVGGRCPHSLVKGGIATEEDAERFARAGVVYTKYARSAAETTRRR